MLKDTLNADLKKSMISREAARVELLRGLKSAILYAEVAANKREEGLSDPEVIAVLRKESKKRQDSVELFTKGGNTEMAAKELSEKQTIDGYLPAQLDEPTVEKLIDEAMAEMSLESIQKQDMGKMIGHIKSKGLEVEGSMLARLIGSRIS
ncbi:MAG: hypothetical protein ACI9T8_000389 [Candidatus Saccharimonadales bacterium]|jgi:uncharacterized protein YqeY